MTLKQRRTPFDHFLLQVIFPMMLDTPLRPCVCLARMWHSTPHNTRAAREFVDLRLPVAPAVDLAQAA